MPVGIPGNPPDVDEAGREIERLKERRADSVACAAVLLMLLPVAVTWHPHAVAALVLGILASFAFLLTAHIGLAQRVETCAAFVGMSRLPDVAERQARLTSPRERRCLAKRLREIADATPAPFDGGGRGGALALLLVDRASSVRDQLIEVAAAVESADHPDAVTIARLWQLVTDGMKSPLYNPMVPAGELEVMLRQARWSLLMHE